jgi:hypothetical protein
MKRRDFCVSALAAGIATTLPDRHVFAIAAANVADLPAVTSKGAQTTLEGAAVRELSDSMRGDLLMSGEHGYDHARAVWNGMIDRKPALIARCEGASDVSHAMTFARERDLLVAVRGGGHSISGKAVCEGGLMEDAWKDISITKRPCCTWLQQVASFLTPGREVSPSAVVSAASVENTAWPVTTLSVQIL